MNPTKLTSLATGEEIATIDTVCLVDVREVLASRDDTYHVLRLERADISKLGDATCGPDVVERLLAALGDADSIMIGYQTLAAEKKWRITGRITDRRNRPLPGLRVLAYDKDLAKADDFLGGAFTDADGAFELRYEEEDFKSKQALIDFEGNPDIYLDITDLASGLSKRTATRGEANESEHFQIKIDFDSKTTVLRPVVGYFFIEEDLLEREVEELEDELKKNPDDANSHFFLALCFIELMKADLKKSEWLLPEMRLDDDMLAIAAMKELDEVIGLDEGRAEDARRYRKYVEELQALAL
jgi:hypothetical protein